MLTKISDLEDRLEKRSKKATLAVAAIRDESIFHAAITARDRDIVDVIMIGKETFIKDYADKNKCDLSGIKIISEDDDYAAGQKAVELINDGKANILMNGQEGYHGAAVITRAVTADSAKIMKSKRISHMALCELEGYHKLIGITDLVYNITPNLKEKAAIISNAVFFMRVLGIEKPKVAVMAAVEVVNETMPATMHAAMLSKMSQRGQLKNCIVEGPLAFDNTIFLEHALHKGIPNDVSGDPDILIAPDIETAGMLYQSFVCFAQAKVASITLGTSVPIVFTTEIDSPETRVNSILMAATLDA
jgi:phosphate butyryltransferase